MKITIGICDDSIIQVEFIKSCINEMNLPYEISFVTAFSGEDLLNKQQPLDIVFLDIEMDGVNGITVGRELHKKSTETIIIFITGFREYALEAFELNSFQYCIKPVSVAKVEELVNKAILRIKEREAYQNKLKLLIIKHKDEVTAIKYDDIFYIEKSWKKIKIHCKNNSYEMYYSIKELVKRIDNNIFYMCHQGFVVNLSKIKNIKGYDIYFKEDFNSIIPISRRYKKQVIETFERYFFNNL